MLHLCNHPLHKWTVSYPIKLTEFGEHSKFSNNWNLAHPPSSKSLAISSGPGNCPLSSLGRRLRIR